MSAHKRGAQGDELTQASVVALLRRLAEYPAEPPEATAAIDEHEFPWAASADTEPDVVFESVPYALPEPGPARSPSETAPSVAYLLPGLPPEGSGGSHSLVQEARGLRALGAQARICVPADSLHTAHALYGSEEELFTTYRGDPRAPGVSDSSLLAAAAGADVAIATEYPSVELLARLQRERPELVCAYYVQDYEPLFGTPETARSDRALLSYRAIPGQLLFAKTHWLRNIVGELHGLPVAKVKPSLDRELFNARGRLEDPTVARVAAMIRPRTPRRRPAATLASLAAIGDELADDAEIVTFGCDQVAFAELGGPSVPRIAHLGPLSREEVAQLMRRCDVFIDASAYQAFGRTGLEAMACGTVPVLPALGGVHEFAVHDQNALILADGSPETIAKAVIGLIRDRGRLHEMSGAGVLRTQEFSIERAASSQLDLFSNALRRRARPTHLAS